MSTPVNWGLFGFASIHTVGMFKCNESGLFAAVGFFVQEDKLDRIHFAAASIYRFAIDDIFGDWTKLDAIVFAVGGIFIELFKGIGSAAIVIAGEV